MLATARRATTPSASRPGELFAFLDADDRFTPDKLDLQQVVRSRRIPGLDVVFGHVQEFVSPELTDEQRRRRQAAGARSPCPGRPRT